MTLFLLGLCVGTLIGAGGLCVVLYAIGRARQKAQARQAVSSFVSRLNASRQALAQAPKTRWHWPAWRLH